MNDPPNQSTLPWGTPEQRAMSSWKKWAMSQAIVLRAAGAIADPQLEATAERIYRWTAFPSKDVSNG